MCVVKKESWGMIKVIKNYYSVENLHEEKLLGSVKVTENHFY